MTTPTDKSIQLASDQTIGRIEPVFEFYNAMFHRQAQFHEGKDLRQKPYTLFRIKIDAGPVLLK